MIRVFAILSSLAFAAAASAEPPPLQDPLLERMVGAWVLTGTIAGRQTTHDVTVEWVLGREYLRIVEVSREKDAAGAPAYEAIVFVGRGATSGEYACLWLDTTGGGGLAAQAIGHARRDGNTLPFVFRGVDGSAFYTTFAYDEAASAWEWRMDGEECGELRPFARVRLTRR